MKVDVSTGHGRFVEGEGDTVFRPRRVRATPLVVYCHPSGGGSARAALPETAEHRFLSALAARGFFVVAPDLGGPSETWGNDLAVHKIQQVIDRARRPGRIRADEVLLVGNSMGASDMLAFAHRGSTPVRALVAIAPVSDLAGLRALGADDLRANIDAAWSVSWPDPLPAGADPVEYLPSLAGQRLLAFFASDDPLVPPASVMQLAAVIGGAAVDLGPVGHATAIAHVPVDHVGAFLAGDERLNAAVRRRRS